MTKCSPEALHKRKYDKEFLNLILIFVKWNTIDSIENNWEQYLRIAFFRILLNIQIGSPLNGDAHSGECWPVDC